ncbi:MAG: DUF3021 domain-containing protein [Bacteroidales bacterium]|nr:DUF3021 domain-containing protein [Bacteroidales bacterium]
MKKKLIIKALIGFAVGAVLGNVITLFFSLAYGEGAKIVFDMQVEAMGKALAITLQTILSGIFGAISLAGTCFFDIDSWSLLQATIAHFVSVLITFLVVASALRWMQYKWINYLILIAMIAVAYFLIWLIMYIIWKQEIKKMNEELKAYKEREEALKDK